MRDDPQALGGRGLEELGWARHVYLVAGAAALAWAGALAAFVLAYESGSAAFGYGPFRWAVIVGLGLLPALFMLLGAHAVRQSARLSAETRRTRALAGDLISPAALAMAGTGEALETMRAEIARATAAAADAQAQLNGLNAALAEETGRLAEAAAGAQRAASGLTEVFTHERVEMAAMATGLDAAAQQVGLAAERQAHILSLAVEDAQVRLDAVEAALVGKAAKLAASVDGAGVAAEEAGRILAQQTDRLERAGAFLGERYRGLEATLDDRHAALEGLAETLRRDQAHASDLLDAQRVELESASARAHSGAAALSEAAETGAQSLSALIADAAHQVDAFTEAARAGQAALEAEARTGLTLFTGAVAEERAAVTESARAAMDALAADAGRIQSVAASHAEDAQRRTAESARVAREQVDLLNEAAFQAGQRADQAFEQRLAAARKLIEQSAQVVDQAGAQSVARIEQGLTAARAALGALDGLFEQADRRIAALPATARAQVEAVHAAVTQGVGELTAAARQAAEETQAIDAAFQARIRRNYEVLSEAVRLMGKVAAAEPRSATSTGESRPYAQPSREAPADRPPERAAALRPPEPMRAAVAAGERPGRSAHATAPSSDALRPAALSTVEPSASALGLRPRLKLTAAPEPAPAPAPLRSIGAVAATPRSAEPAGAGEWTWKDLLSSMDEPPTDDEALADRLISEMQAIGVDSAAALPSARLEAVAAALQGGDGERGRALVREAAPTAVRRLSRRVLTDKVLRQQAERYVRRYEALVAGAARRDADGFMVSTLLSSDAGRAFLLLDAAVREVV